MLSLLFVCSCQEPPVESYAVIPQPAEIAYTPGFVKLKQQPVVAYSPALANEAQMLQSYLQTDFSLEATLEEGAGRGDILLELDPSVLPDRKEGYILEAASGKITIKANDPAGVLNGVQTLRQIIKEKEGKWMVQEAKVTDYPTFSWRAFMLDEGRYFKGKEALFKACVDSAHSYCLTLMDSVFDAGLNEAGYDGTTISLLKGAKSQGRGIKLLTEKSGGSEYSDFINQITEFGYRKLEENFAAKGYPVDEFVAKTIAANITEGVLSVLTRAPEERRQDLMTKLMNFYFRDLGERVGGNGQ